MISMISSLRRRIAASNACLLAVFVVAILTGWAVIADVCSGGGNPYCMVSTSVPCGNATCEPWGEYSSDPADDCTGDPPTPVSRVSVEAVDSWTRCVTSSNDQDGCDCALSTCATATFFTDSTCNDICDITPFGFYEASSANGDSDVCFP